MTEQSATSFGVLSDADIENVLAALRARLNESSPKALLTRPLHRRQVVLLFLIVQDYQALRHRRKDGNP